MAGETDNKTTPITISDIERIPQRLRGLKVNQIIENKRKLEELVKNLEDAVSCFYAKHKQPTSPPSSEELTAALKEALVLRMKEALKSGDPQKINSELNFTLNVIEVLGKSPTYEIISTTKSNSK